MMEVFATQSPYAFGKIRVWGTIGYSVGVQIAGWVYHQFSPQAVYYTVLITIVLSIFCLSAVRMKTREKKKKRLKNQFYSSPSSQWTLPLLYHFDWLGFRGWKYWSYLYSELLMDSGLPVHIASTVVAISVVVEAP